MDKFELNINDAHAPEPEKVNRSIIKKEADYSSLEFGGKAYFYCAVADNEITEFYFANGDEITAVHSFDEGYAEFIKSFFESDVEKYSYNTKYLHRLAASLGTACKNVRGDLMLSAYLLRPSDSNYEISHLCAEYGVSVPEYKNELGSADENVVNAAVLADLFAKTDEKLEEANQKELLENIELPLARVLGKMEIAGFEVDKEGIESFSDKLFARIKELTSQIYEAAGHEFNINSPKRLGVVLFEEPQIPCKKKRKAAIPQKRKYWRSLHPNIR